MAWYDIPLSQIKPLDIIEGCTESILHVTGLKTDKEIIEMVAYRRSFCDKCLQQKDGWCILDENIKLVKHKKTKELITGCGCNIMCKMFLKRAECPAQLWKAVLV